MIVVLTMQPPIREPDQSSPLKKRGRSAAELSKWAGWVMVRTILLVLAVGQVAAGLLLAGDQLYTHRDIARPLFNEKTWGGTPVSVRPADAVSLLDHRDPDVELNVVLDDFDPNGAVLRVTLNAVIHVTNFRQQHPTAVVPSDLTVSSYTPSGPTAVKVPLRQKADGPIEPGGAVPIQLDALGDPRGFPSDAYVASYDLSASEYAFQRVTVVEEQRLTGYDVEANINGVYLNFLMKRSNHQKAWVYTIAASPLALLLAMIFSGIRSRERATSVALSAAVGLLALLPVRQVLVPSNVDGITKVDTLLGIEFLAFASWPAIVAAKLEKAESHDEAPLGSSGETSAHRSRRRPDTTLRSALGVRRRSQKGVSSVDSSTDISGPG